MSDDARISEELPRFERQKECAWKLLRTGRMFTNMNLNTNTDMNTNMNIERNEANMELATAIELQLK